jgi:hypothetical protein
MNSNRLLRLSFVTACVLFSAAYLCAQQAKTWLMLNPYSQESLFATDPVEQANLAKAGWKTNGEGYLLASPAERSAPMERMVKATDKGIDRIFATSAATVSAAKKAGYHSEGVMGNVSAVRQATDMIPVYHLVQGERNLWLIDKADLPWAEKAGWKFKNVPFFLWAAVAP